jgi:molecular chaperone GrpE
MQSHEQDEPTTDAPSAAEPAADQGEVVEPVAEADPRDLRIAELEQQVRELKRQVSEQEGQFHDAQNRLRAVSKAFTDQKAEMASFQARVEAQAKTREAMHGFEAVKAFFDPVQNLQRSIELSAHDLDALVDGIKLVHKQFVGCLTKLGLEPVPGMGADFDPNVHEALALMPVTDPSLDGKVLIVHVDGYMVGNRSIQPAQVVIGSYTPPPKEEEPAEAAPEPSETPDA